MGRGVAERVPVGSGGGGVLSRTMWRGAGKELLTDEVETGGGGGTLAAHPLVSLSPFVGKFDYFLSYFCL
jgi:hypothetical protein